MTAQTANPSVFDVAKKFSEILKQWIPENMQEVIKLNEAEEHPDICHSHDFCDANEAMAEAFNDLGIDLQFGALEDSPPEEKKVYQQNIALWNSAWEIAVKNKFYC